jgi:tetratricopeptide (TPR) repeat protein
MTKRIHHLLLLSCLIILSACNTVPNTSSPKLSELQIQHAEKYAQQGELFQSLYKYKVAKELGDKTPNLTQKISRLEKKINILSDKHYKKGLNYFKRKQIRASRKQLIQALKINPLNDKALSFLKQNYPDIYTDYSTKKGESAKKIAQKVFNDPSKDYIVAYFTKNKNPSANTKIRLPIISNQFLASIQTTQSTASANPTSSTIPTQLTTAEHKDKELEQYEELTATSDIDSNPDITKAITYLKAKQYEQTQKLIYKILESDPNNYEAYLLESQLYYEMGLMQYKQNKYEKALALFNKVEPDYEGLGEAIDRVEAKMEKKKQREFFRKNQPLYQQGKRLVKNKKYLEANEVFNQVDPSYKNITQELFKLKEKMVALAEEYYKKGVNFFVKENLEKAIELWKKALNYNSQHAEAANNLKRAENLLEKLDKY